jgi:hypothetical protein
MDVLTNSDSTIDMDMLHSERTKFARLEPGGVRVNDETFVSRLVVLITVFTVGMTKVFVNNHDSAVASQGGRCP